MKRKSKLIIIIFAVLAGISLGILFFNNSYSLPEESNSTEENSITNGKYGTYNNAVKIVKEVMKDYYIRGPYMQYNYAKTKYGNVPPEEATSQDILHSVCAAYNYDVYNEAFGMKYENDGFPRYNFEVYAEAQKYYNANSSNLDGSYLIYYEDKSAGVKYIYNDSDNISDFASIIQPGDIFFYTGHIMIAYDKYQKQDGSWDVLMLNSNGAGNIKTRINGTSNLFHNLFKSKFGYNNKLDVENEGNIMYFWLSGNSTFVNKNTKKLRCSKDGCAVIRPFYNDNGKAVFNYKINTDNYKRSLLRVQYPGLMIEKTVNKGDNNSVYLGDTLTYTIKITNKSNVTYNGESYQAFEINEYLDDKLTYKSSTNSGTYNKTKKEINWKISSLGIGESIELKYTVKVNDNVSNVGKEIKASGYFYDGEDDSVVISTGTVINKIIPKVISKEDEYRSCYNSGIQNNRSGLNLISYVYECARGNDFNFGEFDFQKIFNKINVTSKGQLNAITLKDSDDETVKTFQKMILNNYWSGMVKLVSSNQSNSQSNSVEIGSEENDYDEIDEEVINSEEIEANNSSIYTLPRWSRNEQRSKMIRQTDMKNGDVLIYTIDYSNTASDLIHTKESGLYAYIYIDGQFVGSNYKDLENERNVFAYSYYNDKLISMPEHLYSMTSKLKESEKDEVLEFANYQTLFDKDYYVILRPELAIEEVEKIEVTTLPTKTSYVQNSENLDLSGGKLTVTYNTHIETIDLTNKNVTVEGFNNSKVGKNTITVKYLNHTTTFDVTIVSPYLEFGSGLIVSETTKRVRVPNSITTAKELLNKISTNYNVTIKDASNKTISASDKIGTDYKIVIKISNKSIEYTINLVGDNNGDTKINSTDLLRIRKHLLKTLTLSGVYFEAADMNNDTKINSTDLLRMRKHLLGTNTTN